MVAQSELIDQFNLFCNQVSKQVCRFIVPNCSWFRSNSPSCSWSYMNRVACVGGRLSVPIVAENGRDLLCDEGLDAHSHSIEWPRLSPSYSMNPSKSNDGNGRSRRSRNHSGAAATLRIGALGRPVAKLAAYMHVPRTTVIRKLGCRTGA
jgi:hypothetical protein